MGVVVSELWLNFLHGRVKLAPPVLTPCMLDGAYSDKPELGLVNNDTIGPHASHFGMKDFDFDPDLFLEVELEGQKCNEEF